jgi:hypothetical protein
MKILNTIFVTLFVTIVVHSAIPQAPASKSWSAASYRGLVMGKSTRADVYKVLGKPKFVGREQDTGIPIMTYEVTDPMPGILVVYVEKEQLNGMTLSPKKRLTKNEIIRLFGSDYIVVRYDSDECLSEGGSAPIYESPNGYIQHMEYRGLGLAINIHDDQPDAIIYTYGPFGPPHSICAARDKKK